MARPPLNLSYGPRVVPPDPPTQPRTMRRIKVNTTTCSRCLGARVVLFQWFHEQECPACLGTGEGDPQ
jgi:hypothetical protein